MGKREKLLFTAAILNMTNTIVQWFTEVSSLGWSRETWLGIGWIVFLVVILALMAGYIFKKKDRNKEQPLSLSLSGASSEKKTEIDDKPELSWLYGLLETDKKEFAKRIHHFRERWFFDNIHATEPFMEVIIQIVNASIFPIVIKGVEGSFEIQRTKCNFDATMSSSRIPHGEHGNIRISQRLSKETVEKMVKLDNERDGFMVDLNACHLVIQAEEPGVENKPVRVSLRIREQKNL